MHRLIREDEKVELFKAFWLKHGRHGRGVRVHEGPWSFALECTLCDVVEGHAVDNEERRAALAYKGREVEVVK